MSERLESLFGSPVHKKNSNSEAVSSGAESASDKNGSAIAQEESISSVPQAPPETSRTSIQAESANQSSGYQNQPSFYQSHPAMHSVTQLDNQTGQFSPDMIREYQPSPEMEAEIHTKKSEFTESNKKIIQESSTLSDMSNGNTTFQETKVTAVAESKVTPHETTVLQETIVTEVIPPESTMLHEIKATKDSKPLESKITDSNSTLNAEAATSTNAIIPSSTSTSLDGPNATAVSTIDESSPDRLSERLSDSVDVPLNNTSLKMDTSPGSSSLSTSPGSRGLRDENKRKREDSPFSKVVRNPDSRRPSTLPLPIEKDKNLALEEIQALNEYIEKYEGIYPIPYKIAMPSFSPTEQMLDEALNLKPKAALLWLCTQTGVSSMFIILVMRYLSKEVLSGKKFLAGFLSYLTWCHMQTSKHTGYWRNDHVRKNLFFRLLSAYYPHKNILTVPLRENRYFFAVHPHGVLALSVVPSFTEAVGLETKFFPQLRIQTCTVDAPFYLLGGNELSMTAGLITAKKNSIIKNLEEGKSIALYVGGADESLLSGSGKMRIILKDRAGFVQCAVITGTPLVPVLVFGETALLRQYFSKRARSFQKWSQQKMPGGFAMPFHSWPSQPHPMYTIFGDALPVKQIKRIKSKNGIVGNEKEFNAYVKEIHHQYIEKVKALHAQWKHLGTAEDQELEILSTAEARKPSMLQQLKQGQALMDQYKKEGKYAPVAKL